MDSYQKLRIDEQITDLITTETNLKLCDRRTKNYPVQLANPEETIGPSISQELYSKLQIHITSFSGSHKTLSIVLVD